MDNEFIFNKMSMRDNLEEFYKFATFFEFDLNVYL